MGSALFFSFIGSLIICMALIPVLATSAARLRVVDVPRQRHAHREPIAKVGGIAFAVATFIAVLVWAPKDSFIPAILLGGAVIMLFGVWDDRVGLHYRVKFTGQVLAASIAMGVVGVRLSSIPFFDDVLLPSWMAVPLTLVVIVGVTNAVNLSDGLDGLAGGLSLISFTGLAYLAYQVNEPLLVLLMVSVLGGLLGFLRFNTYPARVFMGDAGSQFLGHYLAVAAILLTDASRTPYSPLLALFIWGVPLLDTVGVMGQRLMEGRSPFVGDRNHLHHKLLSFGLTHGQAVSVIYLMHGLMVSCAYFLRWQSDAVLVATYLLFVVVILFLFVRQQGQAESLGERSSSVSRRAVASSSGRWTMGDWPLDLLYVAVPFYLAWSITVPREIPSDGGTIAGCLALAVIGSLLSRCAISWVVRAALYIGSMCLLYYGEAFPRATATTVLTPMNMGMAALAALVVLAIRWAGEDRFQTTPLDHLIALLAVAMPFLPEMTIGDVPVGPLMAKAVVLFFAFELLLYMRSSAVVRLGAVSLAMLTGIMWRAWWP
ncbi:MAG: undecaprenyl/decaprenyl-phosphate alpha-N-acetylglucosaminyl 1-phosphate transferase [Nitrospira sp.]|nr:undecaprenyl/decaprenyl-phosphate alpha-N-acetylglucosaminyl 1-phosphate transferase [Nitrospira sp.]